jgi:hypothetical protein
MVQAAAGVACLFIPARLAIAALGDSRVRGPHPTPRPGITGANVLTKEQLADTPDLIPLFDDIRAIPEIADGIRCNCGCAGQPGFYSLLSCYEADGMARECRICEGQGRVTTRLHKEGKTLDEIRVAIDARFG